MSGELSASEFLAEFERELRVVGRARSRILEEIRTHLDEAGGDADAVAGFGSAPLLAARFNDLHATASARRVMRDLALIGPALFATYVMSFVVVRFGELPPAPVRRLTPRLSEDVDAFTQLATVTTSTGFVAATLALAALVAALGQPALRLPAALGSAALAVTALPPLLALGYLAGRDEPRLLAPAALAAILATVVSLRGQERRKTAVTLALLAIAAFGLVICASVAITVINGIPAPTTAPSAVRYFHLALLAACTVTLARAYRTRRVHKPAEVSGQLASR